MQEIPQGIKLSWETVLSQFDKLIKFAAKQRVQNHTVDNMYSAEDLYQIGLTKLYDCWVKWCVDPENNKDMDEFAPIFKTSLFRAVKIGSKPYDPTNETKPIVFVNLDDAVNDISDINVEDTVERLYRENGISRLSQILTNDIAKMILNELYEPSPRTLYEVWADTKRKEMLKSQGKRVNVPKDTTVRMKHIMRALGITTKQYDIAMLEIRQQAKIAFEC